MKEDKELICPWEEKVLCLDSEFYMNHRATRPLPQERRTCSTCCWGPNGESIMAARLAKEGNILIDGKWWRKGGNHGRT